MNTVLKRTLTVIIACALVICAFPVLNLKAASKPASPVIKLGKSSSADTVKLSITKTSGAEGYYIYMKGSFDSKYKKVKSLKKDGTAARSVSIKNLDSDLYSFKVKAYANINGKKVYSAYSNEVTVRITSIPKLIDIKIPKNGFRYEGKTYPKKSNKGSFDISVDESLKDAFLRLEFVDMSGNARPRDIDSKLIINSEKLTFYFTAEASSDLAIMAYANESDADNQVNPIACSDIINVEYRKNGYSSGNGASADPNFTAPTDNGFDPNFTEPTDDGTDPNYTEPEEPKYADITFKNGKAYFGVFPQKKVSDSALIAELNKLQQKNPGSHPQEYNGKIYQLATVRHIDSWYESSAVEWLILEGSAKSESVTLMANTCLLCTGFTDYPGFSAASEWKDSFLRSHLNVYGKKFDGSIWSFDIHGVLFGNQRERVLLDQKYGKCVDKIMLPTKAQIEKLSASERCIKASEMATIAGEYGYWLMDSAGSGKQYVVNTSGKITSAETWKQEYGVVPVIKVSLKNCNIKEK